MNERLVDMLPDIPVGDDEVGVEIVFLEPGEPDAGGTPARPEAAWESPAAVRPGSLHLRPA